MYVNVDVCVCSGIKRLMVSIDLAISLNFPSKIGTSGGLKSCIVENWPGKLFSALTDMTKLAANGIFPSN